MSDVPKLSRLDLNLLLALDALITERSVSRAAERLGLSQPALSASLRRIRIQFSDPILVRRGNSFDLTPLASRLAPHAAIALEGARRVFAIQAEWSPQHSTREFTFYGSDYALSTIGPMVARAAAAEAPDVRLRFQLHSPDIVDDARSRLRSADGIVLPHGFLNALPYQDLWHDTWTIVASADNEAVRQGLTVDDLSTASWVYTYQSRSAFTLISRQLQNLGIEPAVDLVVESFLAMADFIVGTPRLALVQSRLAERFVRLGGLVAVAPPFDSTPVLTALWWHPLFSNDPEHEWMRGLFARAAAELEATPPALDGKTWADAQPARA